MTPWSANPDANTPFSELVLISYPGGGNCPKTLAERPFAPAYSAKSDSSKAGAYSPFRVRIARPDGQQELKVVNVTLPKGLTGKLAGIPYCSEAALAAAEGSSGQAEAANSSCPAASQIGSTSTKTGSGSAPYELAGKAFLAGPYKGAPLSMAVITPGVAGPYDVGTVVVRVALNVNPETGQINAVSDAIPHVFDGVKLDIRSIDVNVDKSKFMLNPTNCAGQAVTGQLNGGGSNPADPAAFSSYPVNAPYQATECNKLAFKPKLHTRLYGPTKRAKNPRIRAILEAREGDANLSRAALTLPHSLFLDQSHIKTVCTRVQLAAKACPSGFGLRTGGSEVASARQQAEGAGLPGLLQRQVAEPGGRPPRSGEHPATRRDQLQAGRSQDRLPDGARSAREEVHPEHEGRQEEPARQLDQHLREGADGRVEPKAQNGKKIKNNKYGLNVGSCKKSKKK